MKKKYVFVGIILILISGILELCGVLLDFLCILKYGTLSYGITLLSMGLCKQYITKHIPLLYYTGIILLCFYTILLLDTYYIHAISFFPGNIRYAMFSMYGFYCILFIPIGIILCFSNKKIVD